MGEQIRIETVTGAGLWTVHADAQQLESAILNVAINARDAMPDGGKLTIETANAYLDDAYCRQNPEVEPGQFAMIAITDTGTGMTPEVASRVFDPFFTTKPAGKGTGLGLSQVYGFVKQSRGHIKIYSEPGAGTTVKIYLPRLVGDANGIAGARGFRADADRRPQRDHPRGRGRSADAAADDGSAARAWLHGVRQRKRNRRAGHSRPRGGRKLLFTDVVMPDINGKKLADEALRRRPDLKVLFTTGYTANAVVHGGVLDPGVHMIGKPFTLDQLAAKVRAVLDE